jgi:ABC-2 type transport system permease protein
MSALISAELLRLRTLRSPRYGMLGVLAFVAFAAAAPLIFASSGPPPGPAETADSLRSLAFVGGVIVVAVLAANNVGAEFKDRSVALTYLSHPDRHVVAAARALTYAGVGSLFAAAAAIVVLAVGVPAAGHAGVHVGFSATDVARVVAGAAFGGAVMGAAGVLLGCVMRHPVIAAGAIAGWNVGESFLSTAGIGPYLPFRLVNSLLGVGDDVSAGVAAALLLGYLTAFGLVVARWALPRDVT